MSLHELASIFRPLAGFASRIVLSRQQARVTLPLSFKLSTPYSTTVARTILPAATSIRHTFHTSPTSLDASVPNHHFDTYKFVQKLENDGFTREQAEAILDSLSEVINESELTDLSQYFDSMANLTKNMVTKAEQEKTVYTYKVDFAQLKSEIQLLGKNDFTVMKTEHDRLQAEIEKLRQKLREEITRTQAGVRLDLNLEKGRIRDEASAQELKIRETDTRIESEIAGLRTQMEAIKAKFKCPST
ncbi:putative mitochondrion protein [Jimgerdemannia flammicorona]|uniref:Putative mitochondrion protein n=1 Tax=Jimgerdemannia flammicorona TaxID=994334 RepID=A0A433QJB7_9FUNG|nr:putative mitochondrion protein [Jimgerdemannia flammicorona]